MIKTQGISYALYVKIYKSDNIYDLNETILHRDYTISRWIWWWCGSWIIYYTISLYAKVNSMQSILIPYHLHLKIIIRFIVILSGQLMSLWQTRPASLTILLLNQILENNIFKIPSKCSIEIYGDRQAQYFCNYIQKLH